MSRPNPRMRDTIVEAETAPMFARFLDTRVFFDAPDGDKQDLCEKSL
jgi:hypothetical protein